MRMMPILVLLFNASPKGILIFFIHGGTFQYDLNWNHIKLLVLKDLKGI